MDGTETGRTTVDPSAAVVTTPVDSKAVVAWRVARRRAVGRGLRIGLIGCFLLALGLRLYGVNFGLPHLYYWDEPTIVNRAVRFGSGDLNPHFFAYPALYMYMIFLVSGLYFALGRVTGHFHGAQDFAAEYFTNPTGVYLTARVTTALIGAAAVVLTYYVGRRYFGRRAGMLGALFLAVSTLHAGYSHIAITDVPHGFFIIAAYLPLYNVMARGRGRDYALAGFLIGLGAATKYLAVLLVVSLLLAHLLARHGSDPHLVRRLRSPKLLLGIAAVFAGFVIGSPYNLLDFHRFIADYRAQAALSAGGTGSSLGYFLFQVLPVDFGWPLLMAAAIGFVLLAATRRRKAALFLLFPVLYFAFISRYPRGFARYMIPEEPFIALLAAYALERLYERLYARPRWRGAAAPVMAVAALLLIAFPVALDLRWDRMMARQPDTRTVALAWFQRNVPAGTTVAVQSLFNRTFFNAPIVTDRSLDQVDRNIPKGGKLGAVRERVLETMRRQPVYRETAFVEDVAALRQTGARFVLVSDQNGPLSPAFARDLERSGPPARFALPSDQLAWLPKDPTILPVVPPEVRIYALR